MKFLLVFVFFLFFSSSSSSASSPEFCLDPRNITIEFSVMTDFALFVKWTRFLEGNYTEAVKGIHYMYANVYKTTRDRLWGVNSSGFRFDMRFTHTDVNYNKSTCIIETGYDIKVNNYTIDEQKAAQAVQSYSSQKPFKPSDVVVLVTGYKLKSGKDSFINGSLINGSSVIMVIREIGQHRTEDIIIQNLASAMGVKRDGEINPQVDSEQFVMSSQRRSEIFNHSQNINLFSSLSTSSFQRTFQASNFSWNQRNVSSNKWDVDWCVRTHPLGQTYPLRRQCQFIYGANSSVCSNATNALMNLTICMRLGCTDPRSNYSCVFAGDQRAYDRTSCGEGKWCLNATCISDPGAPPNTIYNYTMFP